ncbi:MAG TPA: AAA family ATPase, partial [Candidatus Dormibacteraeota bacterium]
MARSRRPSNLPAELTSFVGRDAELARIRSLLQRTRLLTLTGAGGTGKTRLALRAAAELLPAFPDGAWLVDLAPLREEAVVSAAVAGALGLRDETGAWPLARLAAYLGDRRLLLVLDNCEHLV